MHSSITWLYTHSPCPLKWVSYLLKQYHLQVYKSTVPPHTLYMQCLIFILMILLNKGPERGQICRWWSVRVLPNKVYLLVSLLPTVIIIKFKKYMKWIIHVVWKLHKSNQDHFEQFLQYHINKQINEFDIHNYGRMVIWCYIIHQQLQSQSCILNLHSSKSWRRKPPKHMRRITA